MTRDLWYYSHDGEEKEGPTPGDHLRHWISTGQLNGEALVWRPGMGDWMPIQNVEELGGVSPTAQEAVVEIGGTPPPTTGTQPPEEAHGPDTQFLLTVLKQIKGALPLSTKSLLNVVSSKIFWFWMVAPFTVIKMLIVPAIVSRAASFWADGYGIEMSVEDWSADLLDLSATAQNAVVLIPGPYAETEFLSAEAIEVDLSLSSRIFHKKWVRAVRIKEPKIYVERLLSGRWNYQDLMGSSIPSQVRVVIQKNEWDASTSDGKKQLEGRHSFSLAGVSVEEMGLEWVENLPGDSKSGMIQDLKTTLFIDDISVTAKNLIGMVDLSPQRTSLLNLEARTGSGKISFTGEANLFFWKASQKEADGVDWTPTLKGKIYLENIGTNALARLMPDAAILPEGGTITGTIDLEVAEREVECQANLNIRDATFTANQASRFVANDASAINAQLSGYRANGQYQFSCGGHLGEVDGKRSYRPFQAFQTNVVRHGVDHAPKSVRVLATVEHGRYSADPVDPSLESDVDRILGKVDPKWLEWAGLAVRLKSLRR